MQFNGSILIMAQSFFFRPAEIVAPELIGCLLVIVLKMAHCCGA
jgi:3-methyladenine DNA glycosylase Mpg